MKAVVTCSTRSLKNAMFLQGEDVGFFPKDEPLEGFASLLEAEVLATLGHPTLPPSAPRRLAEVLAVKRPPAVRTSAAVPLFSGTLWFVQLLFLVGNRELQVSQLDVSTAMRYAGHCVGPLSAYASQYGANSLVVASSTIPFQASLAEGKYNDQMLAGWVDELAKTYDLGPDSCVIVLNPLGVVNTDADAGQGVLGYHLRSPSGVPYAFVNVLGSGLTVSDQQDYFALALSHEIVEMTVDPRADGSNPETSDQCSGNCGVEIRNYFTLAGEWTGSSPSPGYGFFTCGVVKPSEVSRCPASPSACSYPPPKNLGQ